MPLIPPFIPLITNNQILNGPNNLSFSQIFALVNNVNGGGLDFQNIGTAGISINLFNGGGNSPSGPWTITQNLSAGTVMSNSSVANSALTTSGITTGALAFGRASGSAFLFFGGATTSSFISYNAAGLNEMSFGAPLFVGYSSTSANPATLGNMTPVLQVNGNDSVATRVVRGTASLVPGPTPVTLTTPYTSTSSYIVIVSVAGTTNLQVEAYPVSGSVFNVYALTPVNSGVVATGAVVNWVAIGS
jgi:hypothetical protein